MFDFSTCTNTKEKRCIGIFIGTSLSIIALLSLTCGTWSAVTILYNNAGIDGIYSSNSRYMQRLAEYLFSQKSSNPERTVRARTRTVIFPDCRTKIILLFRGREIYFTLGIAIYLAWTLTLVSLTGAGIYFGNNCGISVDDDQAQNDFQVSI